MAPVNHRALKPLRWPMMWLILWILAMVMVVIACLLPTHNLPVSWPGADKWEHVIAFFVLAASAVQLFATRRALFRAGAWLIILGVLIEFMQGRFTASRTADVGDALADTVGVVLGLALALTPVRDFLLRRFPQKMESKAT